MYEVIPNGYLYTEDEVLLLKLSTATDLCVDLGTCNGRSATILSQRSKQVITVDVFENVNLIKNVGSRAHYQELFEKDPHNYSNVKAALSCYPNISVVSALSHEYALTQSAGTVDVIFFDADHAFTGIQRDYVAWFPKVKRGGIFAFHDATNENWDVKEFCDMLPLMDGEGRINGEEDYSVVEEIEGAGGTRVFRRI